MTDRENTPAVAAGRGPGGKWMPGHSPNPGGRPKALTAVVEAARSHTVAAIAALAEINSDPAQPAAARVSAAQALLDRGWGKPAQPVDGDGEGGPVQIVL